MNSDAGVLPEVNENLPDLRLRASGAQHYLVVPVSLSRPLIVVLVSLSHPFIVVLVSLSHPLIVVSSRNKES